MKLILWRAAIALAILHFWFQILLWLPQHFRQAGDDMSIYYRAITGGSIYTEPAGYGPGSSPGFYFYPPFLALLLRPFAGHFAAYCVCWYSLLIAAFWGFAAALGRLSTGRWSIGPTMICSLVLALTPGIYCRPALGIYWILNLGNVEPVLWLLFALALISLEKRPAWTQVLLAAMVLFKPYAILPLVVVAARRSKQEALPAVVFLSASIGAALMVGGIGPFALWVKDALPLASQGTFSPFNVSAPFAVLRVLHGLGIWHFTNGPLTHGPRLFLSVCSIAGPLLALWLLRHRGLAVQVIGIYLAAVLCSPLCWYTCLVAGFAPLALVIRRRIAYETHPGDRADAGLGVRERGDAGARGTLREVQSHASGG